MERDSNYPHRVARVREKSQMEARFRLWKLHAGVCAQASFYAQVRRSRGPNVASFDLCACGAFREAKRGAVLFLGDGLEPGRSNCRRMAAQRFGPGEDTFLLIDLQP